MHTYVQYFDGNNENKNKNNSGNSSSSSIDGLCMYSIYLDENTASGSRFVHVYVLIVPKKRKYDEKNDVWV